MDFIQANADPFFKKKVLLETAVFYEQSRESFPAFKANCYIMIEFIKVHLLQDNNASLYLKTLLPLFTETCNNELMI